MDRVYVVVRKKLEALNTSRISSASQIKKARLVQRFLISMTNYPRELENIRQKAAGRAPIREQVETPRLS